MLAFFLYVYIFSARLGWSKKKVYERNWDPWENTHAWCDPCLLPMRPHLFSTASHPLLLLPQSSVVAQTTCCCPDCYSKCVAFAAHTAYLMNYAWSICMLCMHACMLPRCYLDWLRNIWPGHSSNEVFVLPGRKTCSVQHACNDAMHRCKCKHECSEQIKCTKSNTFHACKKTVWVQYIFCSPGKLVSDKAP